MNNFKKDFKVYLEQPDLVYLDTAASAQKLSCVIDKVSDFSANSYANIHRGLYDLGEKASAEFEKSREVVAQFLGANSHEIIFTKSATESINLVAYAWGRKNLKKGDKIVLSVAEHHANMVPWILLSQELGFEIIWIGLEGGFVSEEKLFEVLGSQDDVVFVALFGVSNVLGQRLDIEKVGAVCGAKGIRFLVDACQLAVHEKIEVEKFNCDFLALSSHKIYGPSGVGVLYVKSSLIKDFKEMDYFLGGGDAVEFVSKDQVKFKNGGARFEAGTPNIEGVVGLGEACLYLLENQGEIALYESELMSFMEDKIFELEFVKVIGPKQKGVRRGLISFNVEGVHAHDVAQVLAEEGVAVRAGQHCAHPLHEELVVNASVRASIGVYNTEKDILALVEALKKAYRLFNEV